MLPHTFVCKLTLPLRAPQLMTSAELKELNTCYLFRTTQSCAAEWKHCSNHTDILLEGGHTSLNFSQKRRTRKRWKKEPPAQLSSTSQNLRGLIDQNFSLDSGITQWHNAVIRSRLPASETSFYICYFKANNYPDKLCKQNSSSSAEWQNIQCIISAHG